MKKGLVRPIIVSIGIILVLILLVKYLFYRLPQIPGAKPVIVEVQHGVSPKTLIATLESKHIISYPTIFKLYVFLHPKVLKAGEYQLNAGATSAAIWQQLTLGVGMVKHAFTIVPGWTLSQVRLALAKEGRLKSTLTTIADENLLLNLGFPSGLAEGLFLPDTYYYTKGVSDRVILKKAHLALLKHIDELWQKRDKDLPYANFYQALIVASLIEKEAYFADEKPIIAGVIINRLQKNMLLQIDPTVIYGMGARYQGKIYKTDLQENQPFNTYVNKGLPPTPIAMPALSSIKAALHPLKHDYYYFVARNNGHHQFSQNLAQHHQAVLVAIPRQTWYFNELKIKNQLKPIMRSQNDDLWKVY